MISRVDAEAVAADWARAESLVRGSEFEASVDEFDLGYVVALASARRLFSRSDVGTGVSVIDRATGRVSTWPRLPAEVVQRMYRAQRPAVVEPPRTADPEVQLRREVRRRVSPSVSAHATVDGRVYLARGAKGDQDLQHHPLVTERMAEQTPGERVRGCERHAEMIVCSDALHDADRKRAEHGQAPLTLAEARGLLMPAMFEAYQIREPGDPAAGKPSEPCESCVYVLTQLGLLDWGWTGVLQGFTAPARPNPAPEKFPDEVASELLEGDWMHQMPPHILTEVAKMMAADASKVKGKEHRHQAFPAFYAALGQTGRFGVGRRAPGVEQRVRSFECCSSQALYSADVLHEFGQVIGARLFPIGSVAGHSVLAIDELGRVFDLDQAGEWFIADNYIDALITLTTGRRTHRVRDDGTW